MNKIYSDTPPFVDTKLKKGIWLLSGINLANPLMWMSIAVVSTLKTANTNEEMKPIYQKVRYSFGQLTALLIPFGFVVWFLLE